MRLRASVCAVLCAASVLAVVMPAQAQLGPTVRDECIDNGGDPRQCRGLHYLIQPAGVLCREAGGGDVCTEIDGRELDGDAVTAHENSWLAQALVHQQRLDDNEPLQEELWPHTHNAYNAEAYRYTFYNTDPNQLYSITDQLRMGSRAIEIDMHWAHEPDGDPAQGGKRVAVCHSTEVPIGPVNIHVGCGVGNPTPDHPVPSDPTLKEFLTEIRAWLDANPSEVIILYLEYHLEGNGVANAQADQAIAETLGNPELGDLVVKPTEPCGPMPFDLSRAEIRSRGRVVIVGECKRGWPSGWTHNQGDPRWIQSGMSYDEPYPTYPCADERKQVNDEGNVVVDYDRDWIRFWGDLTGLSNGTGGGGDVTPEDARNMVRCGANMIGFDNLAPFDPRLRQLVWSWAENEPQPTGSCAYQGPDGFFRSDGCKTHRLFACHSPAGWSVVGPAGEWDKGAKRCEHAGASFDVPPNGWQNELLKEAKGAGEVWLDYTKVGSSWVPNPS